jgi:hypothetical protein
MQMYPHPNINVPFFSLVYANIMSSPHTDNRCVPLTFWWFELSTYGRVHRADDFAVTISFKFQTTIFFRFPQLHSSKLVIIPRLCWSFNAPRLLEGARYLDRQAGCAHYFQHDLQGLVTWAWGFSFQLFVKRELTDMIERWCITY